jgi:type IV pilus assembly protein PilN
VILINLLPHREAARKRRRDAFYAALGASAVAGGVIAGVIYLWYAAQISNQQGRNLTLQTEIKRLEAQIKDIATLQAEIAALRARQQAVEDLQADRNMPVHLLNELVRQLPDGVYVTSVRQDNQVVTMQGMAQSNERVSELLRNLGNKSAWLSRPDLVEITAANVALTPRDQRRVSAFTMRVRLLRSSEAGKAGGAASGASGAASMPSGAASMPTGAASMPSAAASKPIAAAPVAAAMASVPAAAASARPAAPASAPAKS